jgi:HEAT repeat protein
VRVAAIAAIGELGDMAELPLLVQMLGSETIELQNAAKKSLSRLRG